MKEVLWGVAQTEDSEPFITLLGRMSGSFRREPFHPI